MFYIEFGPRQKRHHPMNTLRAPTNSAIADSPEKRISSNEGPLGPNADVAPKIPRTGGSNRKSESVDL